MRRGTFLLSAALVSAMFVRPVGAEVFELTNDGRLEGELVNASETPREKYVIRTSSGGTITLDREQVARVVTRSASQIEYVQNRPRYADTVEDQWRIAEWCREHGMPNERKAHLERIIELSPDHEAARRALGYTQVGGQWKTQAQRMTERGFVRHKGRWRLPQEVALMQQRREQELAEKGWYRDIKRWLGWLDSSRAQQGVVHIQSIDDPNAVPALAQYLEGDAHEEIKILLVEALARIDSHAAIDALGRTALVDENNEVRLTCLDHLKKQPRPQIVKLYVQSLVSKDNVTINRAAVGLKEMGDPTAVRPLIDALITTHKTKITQGSPGGIGANFGGPGGPGGGGLSVGGKTHVLVSRLQNASVLEALATLTGVSFGYDASAWKHWLSTQQPAVQLDARRD